MRNAYKKLLSANFISAALNFLCVFILLGSEDKATVGMFFYALSIGMFGAALSNTQGWQPLVFYCTQFNKSINYFIKYSLFAEIVLAIFVFCLLSILIFNFGFKIGIEKESINIFFIFLFLPCVSFVNTASGILRLNSRYGILSLAKIISAATKVLACCSYVYFSLPIYFLATLWVGSEIICFFMVNAWGYFVFRETSDESIFDLSVCHLFIRDLCKAWFVGLADIPVQHADKLIIGAIISPELLVVYVAIRRIVSGVALIVDPYYQILLPEFSRLLRDNNINEVKSIAKMYSKNGLALMLVASTLSLIVCVGFDGFYFTGLMYKNIDVFIVFSVGLWFVGKYAYVHPLCYAIGEFDFILRSTIISNFILLVLLFVCAINESLFGIAVCIAAQPLMLGLWKERKFYSVVQEGGR